MQHIWQRLFSKISAQKRRPENNGLISLADRAFTGQRNTIQTRVVVDFGAGVNDELTAIGSGTLTIGAYAAVGRQLWVRTINHDFRRNNMQISLARTLGSDEPANGEDVEIGPATWIGDRVTILAGAKIGAGSIVGAGAVVPRVEIPPYTIWGGVPARFIRARFPEEIVDLLLELQWWTWDENRLKRNKAFLEADLTMANRHEIKLLVVP